MSMERVEGFQSQFEIENADFVFEKKENRAVVCTRSEKGKDMVEVYVREDDFEVDILGKIVLKDDDTPMIEKRAIRFNTGFSENPKHEGELAVFVDKVWFSDRKLYLQARDNKLFFWFGEQEMLF